MDKDRIGQALKALRDADSGVDSGVEAEVRAVLAFRRQQRRRRGLRRVAIPLAIAAAGLITIASWQATRAIPRHVTAVQEPNAREVLTPFYPLMQSSPPFERGLLMRITVPASTMRRVGLPVADDHLADQVEADVLVGQDDLARAIRFVTYTK
jgi:hypothetical protein